MAAAAAAAAPESAGEERKAVCGACLLSICADDAEEAPGTGEAAALLGVPGGCRHAFHAECILTWSTRENSCPQCRKRFRRLRLYDASGGLLRSVPVKTAHFADLLEAEEEAEAEAAEGGDGNGADDGGGGGGEAEIGAGRARTAGRSRTRNRSRSRGRAAGRSRGRGGAVPPAADPAASAADAAAAAAAFRRQLRRRIEADRRRRKTAGVSSAQVIRAVELALARTPFAASLQPAAPAAVTVVVPPFRRLAKRPLAAAGAEPVRPPPRYAPDFLLKQKEPSS